MSFGRTIREAREGARLKQKEVASQVKKENGEAITAQYLNDLEHDRRNPPSSFIIEQLATVLGVNADLLYHSAGKVPEDIRTAQADKEAIIRAYKNLRKRLTNKVAA